MSAAGLTKVSATGLTKMSTRSTRAQMELRRTTLLQVAAEAQPASVRHLYYRAVVAGIVPKTQSGYDKVQRDLLRLRRSGELPFEWIVDDGRRAHWPETESSPESALRWLAQSYRRDPWQEPRMPRVELWCESESIAGMLMPLRDEYAVPIFPLKGQGSDTFVWNAAKSYPTYRTVIVLYAGDYDPAGLQIGVQLEGKLLEYGADRLTLDFRRIAVTDEQAAGLQALGTTPKQRHWVDYSGVRHEFVGQAIEAEAVDPKVMRQLFAKHIVDIAIEFSGRDVFAENRAIEFEERKSLEDLAAGWSA